MGRARTTISCTRCGGSGKMPIGAEKRRTLRLMRRRRWYTAGALAARAGTTLSVMANRLRSLEHGQLVRSRSCTTPGAQIEWQRCRFDRTADLGGT